MTPGLDLGLQNNFPPKGLRLLFSNFGVGKLLMCIEDIFNDDIHIYKVAFKNYSKVSIKRTKEPF